MEEWKEYRLGDVCSQLSDGLHKAPKFKLGGDYIFVNAKNISNGFIVDNDLTKKSTHEEYLKYSSPLDDTSILYSIDGTIGNVALYRGEKVILGKGACYLNPMPNILDRFFLYYELLSPRFKAYIDKMSTGSTIKHISLKTMRNYSFVAPPLQQQRQIACILSSIDNKITCNRQINDNLEQLAQTVLKNWKEQVKQRAHYSTKLETIALFVGGYSYKGKELKPSKKAMATIKNFDRNGGFKLDGYKEIEPSDKVKPGQFVNMFDILVAHTDLTQNAEVIGNAEMVLSFDGYERIVFSMDLVKVIPQDVFPFKFLLAALLRDSDFKSHCMGYVNGTTVLHMSKKALPEFEVLLPKDQSSICQIDTYLSNIYRKMAEIVSESSHLSTLRDTLLPQLMSGELIINELTM